MKKKLTILAFSLLLAVGWTNVAQAQLKAESPVKEYTESLVSPASKGLSAPVTKQALKQAPQTPLLLMDVSSRPVFEPKTETLDVSKHSLMRRAPRRAENDITARATLTFAEADAITYDWVDANGNPQNSKITEPATTPEQIAYLLGTSYMNPNIPGLKYSAVYNMDNPYPNIEFGWDIPNNDRWPSEFVGGGGGSGTPEPEPATYDDIVITASGSAVGFKSIYVYADGAEVTSWETSTSNPSLPSTMTAGGNYSYNSDHTIWLYSPRTITISHALIDGKNNVQVVIHGRMDSSTGSGTVTIGNETWNLSGNSDQSHTFAIAATSGGSTGTLETWSWTAGSAMPSSWSFVDSNCGWGDNGDGTWYVGVLDQNVTTNSFAIFIPASTFTGYSNITVVVRAIADAGYTSQTITVNGSSQSVSTSQIANYTWNNVDASNGITINPKDSYTALASITITGTGSGTSTSGSGFGLTIAAPDLARIKTITVYNQNNTSVASWNAATAYNNSQYSSYSTDNGSQSYYTLPGWTCSGYFDMFTSDGYTSGLYGRLWDSHIHIPASYFTDCTSLRVVINAYGYEDGYVLAVNGEEKTMTTSAADYTWTFTDLSTSDGTVIPPNDNGYTVFLVKVNDNVPAAMNPSWTYSWNNGTTSLLTYFETYIDEVQLLTDGTRLNENTDDAGTMFAYSGELGRFYFLGKGNSVWFGSSEADENPHLAPTYDMYEEFSPTSTDNGADITDFYSKLLYGNSYNVIHDCRGMNYFQHYFTMSGLAGDEHRSMTNLIFWIPDNRNVYNGRNYNEEYLPHVGLYTITLEAEAQRAADYSTENRMYDVTCEWVSSLNSILDFDVDQDYELWVYIYDDQGNPVADYMVLDRLGMQDLLIHNETTFTYQVPQLATSQTIVYRVKGWPKDASNNPAKGGDFFAMSNLDPVLIPGYENFLTLSLEHYESDFALDVEHNYYRNFLTVNNQNPDNALTAARIENGEDEYELYRYDVAKPTQLTKAADLLFSVDNNKIEYLIDYDNQNYVDEALVYNEYNDDFLQGYENQEALGCPTYGEIATLSEGGSGGPTQNIYEDITIKPSSNAVNFYSILVKSDQNSEVVKWTTSNGNTLPSGLTCSSGWTYNSSYGGYTSGTLTVDGTLLTGMTNVQVVLNAYGDTGGTRTITVNGVSKTISNGSSNAADYTWDITPSSTSSVFTLLNNFLNNSTYTQVGQVVFELPWKSIQVKLQDESAGTSSGYFLIQNGGKLRFVMPAGYNNANLKFVIHNAPVTSNYYDGTFTLRSSTGDTQTITIPSGGTVVDGDKDYDAIFEHISSGDVITITGTHTVDGTVYNYSPDFTYIKVYVQGGTGGISEHDPLNLDAIKFVDQFKAETKNDTHPYRYGYVLKAVGNNQESGRPEVPVLHTNSTVHGFYSLDEINNDVDCEMVDPVNVLNAEVNMTLSRDPEIYYYTLDRNSTASHTNWEAVSKLQKREDDSYQEMFDNLPQYDNQICNPPADISTTSWTVDRYDNDDIKTGSYNSFMSYVPVIWTHGDQKNRRVKWTIENRHNSYGSPIWKTGVAQVTLIKAKAERQEDASTKWTYNGEDCSLYMLDDIEAIATMPTVNNVKYVPYMFRIFVKSANHKLRGYQKIAEGVNPDIPGEHFEGAPIADEDLLCVWSGYVNDPNNANYNVTVSENVVNGAMVYTFHKDKVDRTVPGDEWDTDMENAIFAAPEDLIQGEGENMFIDGEDLTIVVRFYYLVEGFDASVPDGAKANRGSGSNPAGYGTEGDGKTPGPSTDVKELTANGIIESVTYYNSLGMQSDKPFDGVNIVVTRYSNGTTRTKKVVR